MMMTIMITTTIKHTKIMISGLKIKEEGLIVGATVGFDPVFIIINYLLTSKIRK